MPSAQHLSQLDQSIEAIRATHPQPVAAGVILGSGLSEVAESFQVRTRILYNSLPYFPRSSVAGHPGSLVIVEIKPGFNVAFFQGRVHAYEGHSMEDVVYPVRLLKRMGAKTLVVTNASGGVNPDFKPGDLMLIEDHINLTGLNPLTGPNDESLGPRFCDMTQAYCADLKKTALATAKESGVTLRQGVYVAMPGPSYETPAEVRMLRTLGADAVGMSTVPEVIAARHMGMDILGISCIANAAAGVSPGECLSHEDVLKTMAMSQTRLNTLLTGILKKIS